MKILISFLVFLWSNCEIVLDQLKVKLDTLERDLYEDNKSQSERQCNQKFLQTFGIAGYQFAQQRPSSRCPYIQYNCCTPQDERITELAWNEQGETVLGKRYSVYIKTLEYLLGFHDEAINLMNDLLLSNKLQCRKAALNFKSQRSNNALIQGVLEVIKIATSKVIDIRKGTYCSICDSNTSLQLQQFWNTQNEIYNKRFFYSKHFCKTLVAETIQSSYFITRYVKQFLEGFGDMISCKANNSTSIEFELPKEEIRETRNCMFFKDKNFFFFCERYCENFNLTKFSSIFDGYIEQLKNFTRHIARYRQEMFYNPNKNIFLNNVASTEEFLLNEGINAERQEIFVKSRIFNFQVDQLKTDFVYTGGVDLTDSYKNADYPVQFLGQSLLKKHNKAKLIKDHKQGKINQRKAGLMDSLTGSAKGGANANMPPPPKVYTLEKPKILEIPSQEFPGEVYKDNWNSLFFMDMPSPKDEYGYEYAPNQPTSYVENSQIYYPQAYTGGFRVLIQFVQMVTFFCSNCGEYLKKKQGLTHSFCNTNLVCSICKKDCHGMSSIKQHICHSVEPKKDKIEKIDLNGYEWNGFKNTLRRVVKNQKNKKIKKITLKNNFKRLYDQNTSKKENYFKLFEKKLENAKDLSIQGQYIVYTRNKQF